MAADFKLQIALTGDDRQLKATLANVIKDITQVGRVAGQASKPIEEMSRAANKLRGIQLAQGLQAQISTLERSLREASEALASLQARYRQTGDNSRQFAASMTRAEQTVQKLANSLLTTRSAYAQLSTVLRGAGINVGQLATESDRLTQEQLDAAEAADKLAKEEAAVAAAGKALEQQKRAEAAVTKQLTAELNRQVEARQKERAAAEAAVERARAYVANLKQNYLQKQLLDQFQAAQKARAEIERLTASYQKLESTNLRPGRVLTPVAATRGGGIGRGEIATIGALTAAATPAVREMERLRTSFDATGAAAQRNSKTFNLMTGQVYGLVGAYVSLRGAWLALQDTFKQGTQLEIINAGLKFAIGNAEGAQEAFNFLRRETDRLGISFDSAATQFAQLAAATRGTSLEGQQTREIFLGIAEAARAAGLANEQVEGTLRAVTQIASKGVVQYEELRGQLGDRLPAALRIAAQAMNMTQGELTSLITAGKLTAQEFLPAFARALREDAAASLDQATNTGVAAFARLENAWRRLQRSFAQGGLMDEVVKVFNEMADAADQNIDKAKEWGREFAQGLRTAVEAVKDATVWLKEHWEIVKALIVSYIGIKIVVAVAGWFNTLAAAVGRATNAMMAAKAAGVFSAATALQGKAIVPAVTAKEAVTQALPVLTRFAGAFAVVGAAAVAAGALIASGMRQATEAMKEARESAEAYRASQRDVMARNQPYAADMGPSTQDVATALMSELKAREEALAKTEEYWRAQALLEADALGSAKKSTKQRLDIARDELRRMNAVIKDRLAVEKDNQKNLQLVQKQMTAELQAELKNRVDAYEAYIKKRQDLEAQDKAFGEKAKEVEKKINAPAADLTKGTVLEPLKLRQAAEKAIDEGDFKKARQLAEEALDALGNLGDGALATKRYLLEMLQSIKDVYQTASEKEDEDIGVDLDATRAKIEEILAKIEMLKNINVSIYFDKDGALAQAQAIRDAIQAIFNTIVIPGGTMTNEALKEGIEQNMPTETPLETRASGGPIFGPGTDRSDSILARVSNGEYVVQAPSVRKVGRSVMDYINRLGKLPKFNFGGLVPMPMLPAFAGGGSVGTPVHLHIGGESLPMSAAPDVAATLRKVVRTEVLKRGRR